MAAKQVQIMNNPPSLSISFKAIQGVLLAIFRYNRDTGRGLILVDPNVKFIACIRKWLSDLTNGMSNDGDSINALIAGCVSLANFDGILSSADQPGRHLWAPALQRSTRTHHDSSSQFGMQTNDDTTLGEHGTWNLD